MKIPTLMFYFAFLLGADAKALVFERDQRADIEHARDPKVKELARSVFTFVPKAKLARQEDGSWAFADPAPLSKVVNLCADEPFASDDSVGSRCSGALIGPNLALTAGHCVSPLEIPDFCAGYYVVFDYIRSGGLDPARLGTDSVFECKRIRKIEYSKTLPTDDYAVIELDRPALHRRPFRLRTKGRVKDGQRIFMLGYPKGMSQKISEDRTVTGSADPGSFSTDLDCFHGNSGSPVLNADSYEIEGVFVRGNGFVPNGGSDPNLIGDFYPDTKAGCNRTLICRRAEGCTGHMDATRATRIRVR